MIYIMSAVGYMYMDNPIIYGENKRAYEFITRALNTMNAYNDNHKFGVLFNAFQEKDLGSILSQYYQDTFKTILADSGGLQIVSANKSIDDDMKKEIYQTQARNAKIAMSFDEIPIVKNQDGSGDMRQQAPSSRRIDQDNLIVKAKQSGENIIKQIETFLDEKSNCKPFVVIHGNNYDNTMRWCDTIIKTIPQDMHQYIGGAAMAFTALGNGELEAIKSAFYSTQLPFDFKDIHFLGMGVIRRLMPIIVFRRSGLYQNQVITYDSTTHTSATRWGRYLMGDGYTLQNMPLDTRYWVSIIYDDIKKHFPFFDVTETEYERFIVNGRMSDLSIEEKMLRVIVWSGHILSSMLNLTENVEKCVSDDTMLIDIFKDRIPPIMALHDVKSNDDFNRWISEFGKSFASDPIGSGANNTNISKWGIGGAAAAGIPQKAKRVKAKPKNIKAWF